MAALESYTYKTIIHQRFSLSQWSNQWDVTANAHIGTLGWNYKCMRNGRNAQYPQCENQLHCASYSLHLCRRELITSLLVFYKLNYISTVIKLSSKKKQRRFMLLWCQMSSNNSRFMERHSLSSPVHSQITHNIISIIFANILFYFVLFCFYILIF